jgi:hypothetical protein
LGRKGRREVRPIDARVRVRGETGGTQRGRSAARMGDPGPSPATHVAHDLGRRRCLGLLRVDVARHVALAYAREGRDHGATLARIRQLFDAEWSDPLMNPRIFPVLDQTTFSLTGTKWSSATRMGTFRHATGSRSDIVSERSRAASSRPPSLTPSWHLQADVATCFGLVAVPGQASLISHGELEIVRLALDGTVLWRQGGRDIFTGSLTGDRYWFDLPTGEPRQRA